VITGIEIKNGRILDFVQEKDKNYFISGRKISKINHGSGCNYSAAIIFALVSKKSIKESMKFAKEFTYSSIKNARNRGKGIVITSTQEKDNIKLELLKSINKFGQIKNIYKNIPECQTNFVYSKKKPNSVKDVLGISGRIVKTGKEVTLAGDLTYGGSKHVASALLVMNKKFPQIYSAINLKYENKIIGNIKKAKLKVCNYDRTKEPKNIKLKGSTIKWGIKNAIKDVFEAPDIIYHKGGFGKEPMIVIFGVTPNDVLGKILKIV
jgi:hydroxymethylpyrimidine/phosphomethylpyrimidine kinase